MRTALSCTAGLRPCTIACMLQHLHKHLPSSVAKHDAAQSVRPLLGVET